MNLTSKRLFKVNWLAYFLCNYLFRSRIKRTGSTMLVPYMGTQLKMARSAKIRLRGGDLLLNFFETFRRATGSSLILEDCSVLNIGGSFAMYYGADIKIFEGGTLSLGSGYANAGFQVRCKKQITIGHNVSIAKDVVIMDSDAHEICYEGYVMSKDVCIEDNVWIGTRAMILKGVTVGEGAIIGAGSIVTKNVPAHSVVAGSPARVIRTNVDFKP